jgi:polyphosphate kinase 2 (PPK2 family)
VADALGAVPLTRSLPYDKYRRLLEKWQRRLARRTRRARREGLSTVLVFEGWDAAGKGGVIRRITNAMAVRDYRVVPIAAPTAEEKRYHYLWRFWRELPPAGRMVIFDRSWYGRVLVERIEGFASPEAWRRAYAEIRDFERQLADHGIVLAKFWLHIDPEEQLRRFKAREQTPYKKYKITDEDYRNRAKWDQYAVAVNDMVAETDKPHAPWRIVAANDKRWARVEVLKTVCKRLDRALDAL